MVAEVSNNGYKDPESHDLFIKSGLQPELYKKRKETPTREHNRMASVIQQSLGEEHRGLIQSESLDVNDVDVESVEKDLKKLNISSKLVDILKSQLLKIQNNKVSSRSKSVTD